MQLVISDAYEGLKTAIGRVTGARWQRCTVHVLRDMQGHVSRTLQPVVATAIRQVFAAENGAKARERLDDVVARLDGPAGKVASLLEDACEDLLGYYDFPREPWSKLRSTNPLERLNKEIGRRSGVVGSYPNGTALLRLAGMVLLEQHEEWSVGRRYLSETSMRIILTRPTVPETTPVQLAVRPSRPWSGCSVTTQSRISGALGPSVHEYRHDRRDERLLAHRTYTRERALIGYARVSTVDQNPGL